MVYARALLLFANLYLFLLENNAEDPAVSRFREYLRIDTSPPNPQYEESVLWIKNQAEEIGLEYNRLNFPKPNFFVLRLTWRGSNSSLKSILLNSHIDVVPAEADKWIYPPFAAYKDSTGNIYGRGSVDRKSLGALYLEVIRRLKENQYVPLRTIHITFVPDEELGGFRGMKPFTESDEFQQLNVGFALDEGGYGQATYAERSLWQFNVTAAGRPFHAAAMLEDVDNAGAKLLYVMNTLFAFRKTQLLLLQNANNTISDVTSINLSMIGGGLQPNIVSSEFWAVFDMRIRLSLNWGYSDAEKMLNDTCTGAGPDVTYKFIVKNEISDETVLNETNQFWMAIKFIHDQRRLPLQPAVLSQSSDARFLRKAGIPTIGYSSIKLREGNGGIHAHNENLHEQEYLDGINLFKVILHRLAQLAQDY